MGKIIHQPTYHVVLLNDDDHTYEYVIQMLGELFGYSVAQAYLMAVEVDTAGRVVVMTTTLDRAQMECERILAYGPDPRMPRCRESMKAVLELAE